jgi:hypothetical protein
MAEVSVKVRSFQFTPQEDNFVQGRLIYLR